jgi:drug/metabolite transporter (DMT)-like permease
MFKLPWEGKRIFAVFLATAGVMAVIYGGASSQGGSNERIEISRAVPTAPLLGDLLTLVASVGYGLYQVLYKRYLALPSGPELEGPPQSLYAPIPRMSVDGVRDADPLTDDFPSDDLQPIPDATVTPPPFGLHPNLLTSLAGILTLLFLWIPLPVLHYVGAEPFRWPPNWYVALVISGIALSGVVFNAGFMVISRLSVCVTKV